MLNDQQVIHELKQQLAGDFFIKQSERVIRQVIAIAERVIADRPYPRWYVRTDNAVSQREQKPVAFHRYDTEESGVTYHTDGTFFDFCSATDDAGKLEVTESEAIARLHPDGSVFDPQTFTSDWGPFPKHEPAPAKLPRETPVRLWGIRSYLYSHGMAVLCCPAITGPPTNEDWIEIKAKPDGTFYVEDQAS